MTQIKSRVLYLGLGSNLMKPVVQLRTALEQLSQHAALHFECCSSFYQSKPVGPVQYQPDFINAVARLKTSLDPEALLILLKKIEKEQGRQPSERGGPRCIDLDILLYGNEHYHSKHLNVPHLRLYERAFVLVPLAEIAPQLRLPNGKTAIENAQRLDQTAVQRLQEPDYAL